MIKVMIKISIEVREVRDFIDCDAKRCFISQSLTIDTKFFNDQLITKRIQVIDNRNILLYDKYQIVITIYNNESVNRIVK